MTGKRGYIEGEETHPTVSMLGFRLDSTFTVANLIQITLLVIAVVGGSFAFYYGIKGQLADLSDGQTRLDSRMNSFVIENNERRSSLDARVSAIEARVSATEMAQNIAQTNMTNMQSQMGSLGIKIDNLDNFLRTYLIDMKMRERNLGSR